MILEQYLVVIDTLSGRFACFRHWFVPVLCPPQVPILGSRTSARVPEDIWEALRRETFFNTMGWKNLPDTICLEVYPSKGPTWQWTTKYSWGVSSFFIQIGQMIFQNNPKPLDFSLILFLGFLKVS